MKNNFRFLLVIVSSLIIMNLVFGGIKTKETFSDIATHMGYDIEKKPSEIVTFTIPEEFDAVYRRYNNLLKNAGYDLEKYKGKECMRYTYIIKKDDLRLNVIVYNNEVIGADISSNKIDGMMIPVKKK